MTKNFAQAWYSSELLIPACDNMIEKYKEELGNARKKYIKELTGAPKHRGFFDVIFRRPVQYYTAEEAVKMWTTYDDQCLFESTSPAYRAAERLADKYKPGWFERIKFMALSSKDNKVLINYEAAWLLNTYADLANFDSPKQ